jgi:hypothetical protein
VQAKGDVIPNNWYPATTAKLLRSTSSSPDAQLVSSNIIARRFCTATTLLLVLLLLLLLQLLQHAKHACC